MDIKTTGGTIQFYQHFLRCHVFKLVESTAMRACSLTSSQWPKTFVFSRK